MRDEIAFRPYRVAIITLDSHAAGPVARVSPRLAQDFSGLSVDVFAAGEWSENPLALAQCRAAVAQADLIVVNLLFKLVKLTAESLKGKGFDVEIVERHHRFKKDSPSGTAAQFAEIIRDALGGGNFVHGREGIVGERTAEEIGIHAVRGGDNVGEHTIIFTTLGETLELVHKGHSRDSYTRGALLAAKFLSTKGAGRYTMADVLGL